MYDYTYSYWWSHITIGIMPTVACTYCTYYMCLHLALSIRYITHLTSNLFLVWLMPHIIVVDLKTFVEIKQTR